MSVETSSESVKLTNEELDAFISESLVILKEKFPEIYPKDDSMLAAAFKDPDGHLSWALDEKIEGMSLDHKYRERKKLRDAVRYNTQAVGLGERIILDPVLVGQVTIEIATILAKKYGTKDIYYNECLNAIHALIIDVLEDTGCIIDFYKSKPNFHWSCFKSSEDLGRACGRSEVDIKEVRSWAQNEHPANYQA